MNFALRASDRAPPEIMESCLREIPRARVPRAGRELALCPAECALGLLGEVSKGGGIVDRQIR